MRVVVMGAGIIGVSTAWHLLERGHEVTLVDRQPDAALETSFAKRKMHLGYRLARPLHPVPGSLSMARLRGHEFHYATILDQPDMPLAAVEDANGDPVPETGSCRQTAGGGRVSGTFFHLIAEAP